MYHAPAQDPPPPAFPGSTAGALTVAPRPFTVTLCHLPSGPSRPPPVRDDPPVTLPRAPPMSLAPAARAAGTLPSWSLLSSPLPVLPQRSLSQRGCPCSVLALPGRTPHSCAQHRTHQATHLPATRLLMCLSLPGSQSYKIKDFVQSAHLCTPKCLRMVPGIREGAS